MSTVSALLLIGGIAVGYTVLLGCGPAPTEPSASPSTEPSATAAPTAEPSAEPSATPASEPTPQDPPPPPSAEPSEEPLPSVTLDISTVERTTFNGRVYDDTEAPVDGVLVKVRSLNATVPYEAETTAVGGTYSFNNAPSGVHVEILASKDGWTTRRRVEVLKSNKDGDPDANRYDFSGNAVSISDKPEVIAVTPGRNASGVEPNTNFVLKFSEAMDTATVEEKFTISAFNVRTLSVDDPAARCAGGGSGSPCYDDNGSWRTVGSDGGFDNRFGDALFTENDFDFSWNSDNSEVTATFKPGRWLPTDRDANVVPDYEVHFTDDFLLEDADGISRREKMFKLTDGAHAWSYKFAITTDEERPKLSSIVATSAESGAASDRVEVRFDEAMLLQTQSGTIASGLSGVDANKPRHPSNYRYMVTRGGNVVAGPGEWPGTVSWILGSFDRVLLTVEAGADLFQPGDLVEIEVAAGVRDPAGNGMDPNNNEVRAPAQ